MTPLTSKRYVVVATPVFRLTLKKLCAFLKRKHDGRIAASARDSIKQRVAELAVDPSLAPVSDRLEALGITDYRQLLVDQHNLVFYRVDERAGKVILILAMDARQSVKQLLYEINISL